MDLDVAKLTDRVAQMLRSKKPPQGGPFPQALAPFESLLSALISEAVLKRDLQKKHTVLEGCDECLEVKRLAKAKVIGNGHFGTVFDVGSGRCVKVERVVSPNVARGVDSAIRMGKRGVGCKVHKWHLCACGPRTYLVLEMDRIEGVTLDAWLRKKRSCAALKRTRTLLQGKIDKMRRGGVMHADLHPGNVIVDKEGEPWIIDFTYESDGWVLQALDRHIHGGVDELVGGIAAALLKEGLIKVTAPAAPASVVTQRLRHGMR